MAVNPAPTLRAVARDAVQQFQNADKRETLKKLLLQYSICYATEAGAVAARTILQDDKTRIRAAQWIMAERLFEVCHGQQAPFIAQPIFVRDRFLHMATEAMNVERMAFEDITHPERIQDALYERTQFEVAKQQRHEEWRAQHEGDS
jgi:hypothetical protein